MRKIGIILGMLISFYGSTSFASEFLSASFDEDIDRMSELLNQGADINQQNERGQTALHLNYYNSDVVEFLLKNGVDANIQDEDGDTVLHYIAKVLGMSLKRFQEIRVEYWWFKREFFSFFDDYKVALSRVGMRDKGKELNYNTILLLSYGASLSKRNNDGFSVQSLCDKEQGEAKDLFRFNCGVFGRKSIKTARIWKLQREGVPIKVSCDCMELDVAFHDYLGRLTSEGDTYDEAKQKIYQKCRKIGLESDPGKSWPKLRRCRLMN